jgi:replicative DNA helicase
MVLLADLRESGDIEQDADRVLFLYREIYYLERNPPTRHGEQAEDKYFKKLDHWESACNDVRGIAEIIIGKDRHGPGGTVKVHWDANRMRFENLATVQQ